MTKREIRKNLIKEDFILTSSLKNKVLNKVGIVKKQKSFNFKWLYSSLVLACSLILVLGLFVVKRPENYSTIFIDINPSISLKVNNKEIVKEVMPLNDDGIIFVADLDLIDKKLDDAIDILIDEAIKNGYFTDDFANISISTFNKDEKKGNQINAQIQNRIKQKVANINIIDQEEEAKELGISPGKLAAINKAIKADENLTLEEALTMKEEALLDKINDQAKQNKQKHEEKFKGNNEDERRIIHLIDQMNSIIHNINNKQGKHREAYYQFKQLYEEYLSLKQILNEEFLSAEVILNFTNLLDQQVELLEIIDNLEERDSDKPGGSKKEPEKPGGPKNEPDNPGGPGKGDGREEPGGNGKNKEKENNLLSTNKNRIYFVI